MNKLNEQESKGAICELCGQNMLTADGCDYDQIVYKGHIYERIKVGDEKDLLYAGMIDIVCHDCGAKEGHYHHIGCDSETCPVCGEQLIGCECDSEFRKSKEE